MPSRNRVQNRSTLAPNSLVVAMIRAAQSTKHSFNVVFALMSAEFFHANSIGIYRVGNRDPVVPLTYLPTALVRPCVLSLFG